mgnify:CR=1 FL=1
MSISQRLSIFDPDPPEEAKVHTMLIIGAKEQEADAVAVRVHGKGNCGVHPREKVVKDLLEKIALRSSEDGSTPH